MNFCLLIGEVMTTPELEKKGDYNYLKLTLGVQRDFRNQDGVFVKDYIPVIFWEASAQMASCTVKKGSYISVKGRIVNRTLKDDENKPRHYLEVVGDKVSFVSNNECSQEEALV